MMLARIVTHWVCFDGAAPNSPVVTFLLSADRETT